MLLEDREGLERQTPHLHRHDRNFGVQLQTNSALFALFRATEPFGADSPARLP
jgi:hypothetical protein